MRSMSMMRMKKIMGMTINKIQNMLKENIVLLILVAGVGIGILLLAWNGSVEWCLKMIEPVGWLNLGI